MFSSLETFIIDFFQADMQDPNPVERGVAHYPPLTAVAPAGPKYQWV